MKVVSNCPLCKEQALHVIEEDGIGTQQCINCGYGTTSRFIGTKEDNETFKTLPEEMQEWSVEDSDRIWIPSMITLPFGTLYPVNIDGEMKWGFAEMVDIPEEEQKNYDRNRELIDLSCIPPELEAKIYNEFDEVKVAHRSKILNYFITRRLKTLIEVIDEF
mgnify:CR=1 FL=1